MTHLAIASATAATATCTMRTLFTHSVPLKAYTLHKVYADTCVLVASITSNAEDCSQTRFVFH